MSGHSSLKHLPLAEPLSAETEKVSIDVLIGSDHYFDFILTGRTCFPNGLILLESKLGFICTGTVTNTHNEESAFLATTEEFDLKHFWQLEGIGVHSDREKDGDQIAVDSFEQSVRQTDGRYVVSWPWRCTAFDLQDNYGLAYGRLQSLLRRLDKDQHLMEQYDRTIKEQAARGVIEIVSELENTDGPVHYLPHHCVVKPDKATTKVRVVYDASAKSKPSFNSLNECLYPGPVLLPIRPGILIRFRLFPIAITSDVEKAFLQLGLQEKNRDVTLFLWVKDITKPLSRNNLVTYRFARVPVGVVSSLFLLAATVRHHLTSQDSPEQANEVLPNMYVDNILVSKNSVKDANEYYSYAKSIFSGAAMNRREWGSSSQKFMEDIPDHDRSTGAVQKCLGVNWNMERDTLNVPTVNAGDRLVRTKREHLQAITQFFDPLGFHAPLLVSAKILMQDIWRTECG